MKFGRINYYAIKEHFSGETFLTLKECKERVQTRLFLLYKDEFNISFYPQSKPEYKRILAVQNVVRKELYKEHKTFYLKEDLNRDPEYKRWRKVAEQFTEFDEKIEVIFWSKEYESFISFVKTESLDTICELLNYDLNNLRKIDGYNRKHIIKIRKRLVSWCNDVYKRIHAGTKEEKPDNGTIESLIDHFFLR
jgi:hypothetical protein